MTNLLHLAEQKYARQLAENAADPKSTPIVYEPWRLLLDAMADALTGEARERVAERLRDKPEEPWKCPWCNVMISGKPPKCPQCRAGIVYGGPPLVAQPIADEPEPAPDPDPCSCEETERLRKTIAELKTIVADKERLLVNEETHSQDLKRLLGRCVGYLGVNLSSLHGEIQEAIK